jgi:hypothetical protein
MCVACCDIDKLAKDPKFQAIQVNPVRLIASDWTRIYVTRGTIIRPVDTPSYAGNRLSLSNDRLSTTNVWSQESSDAIFIPYGGEWWIYNHGTTDVEAIYVDTYCGAAYQAYARDGYAAVAHSQPSVTTATTTVLAANRNRKYACFVNDHASQTVYLHFSATAVANRGIRLNAAGASYEMSGKNLYRGHVAGISVGGTSVVLVTEGS